MCFESIFFSYFRYCDGELLSLCNWLRHSLLSLLLLRLGICFHTGRGWKMYFSVTRARVRERWIDGMSNRVSCRRETARPPPLPFPSQQRMHATSARWGEYISRVHGKQLSDRLNCGSIAAEFAPVSLSLSLSLNFRLEISAGTHASHVRAGVIKIWPHVGKNKKKRGGRKTQFEIE